jgi:DNA/RNA-binding domain of Phe-tRNA-synthetase-like protein
MLWSGMQIARSPHPRLDARAFVARFAQPLGSTPTPPWLATLLSLQAEAPLQPDDAVRAGIRDLLRHGGYKPTGRGKPASEYLLRAAEQGALPVINVAVDACNAVSLHSGLPISVVDLDRVREPLRIALSEPGLRYVFNAAGQEIDVAGLICLHDADGPCANPVKDAQRSKTTSETRNALCIVWGDVAFTPRVDAALDWYRSLLERAGATIEPVAS